MFRLISVSRCVGGVQGGKNRVSVLHMRWVLNCHSVTHFVLAHNVAWHLFAHQRVFRVLEDIFRVFVNTHDPLDCPPLRTSTG